jgi:hypothetical protein
MLYIASIALIFSSISCIIAIKAYRKSRRTEFLQRRDLLFQAISNLNDRNTEFQLISARYGIVAAKNEGLPLQGEQAERNMALIASIKVQREGVEEGIKLWDENIAKLHLIYSTLILESDAPAIEKMITNALASSVG